MIRTARVMSLFALGVGAMIVANVREASGQPTVSRYTCESDVDCVVVTSLPSCQGCATCQGARSAVARRYLEARTRDCRTPRGTNRPTTCPPCPAPGPTEGEVEAVCRERMCTLRDVAP